MVVRGERLDLKSGVVMQGRRITALRTESGKTFKGAMFIDASYEGDLLPGAGVRYTIGREANSLYNETLNGVQAQPLPTTTNLSTVSIPGISRATLTAVCCPESGPNPVPTAAETSVSRLTTSACA